MFSFIHSSHNLPKHAARTHLAKTLDTEDPATSRAGGQCGCSQVDKGDHEGQSGQKGGRWDLVNRIIWLITGRGCEAKAGSRRPGGGDDGLSQVGTVAKMRGVLFQVEPAGCAAGQVGVEGKEASRTMLRCCRG